MKKNAVLMCILLATLALAAAVTPVRAENAQTGGDEYIQWLQSRSMLYQAELLERQYMATGKMWQHPYALPQPRRAAACASVWFTAYPAATITKENESVLKTLSNEELWKIFSEIGIKGMHTGPMKRSGGITGRNYTPTVDGNFDRIGMEIDPAFGTQDEYLSMVASARKYGAILIGDVIPGHTGKGADFRLAERNYRNYPGIFHMVAIDEKDWGLLPPVPAGKDSVNLSPAVQDELKQKGYIVGKMTRVIFFEPGIKETNWSATDVVKGVDGKNHRWVYLHYFKEGQPTLNWLDPTFAAEQLLIGDAIHSLKVLGEGMLRLDANGFLGIEPADDVAWSEGHPLSVTCNEIIGMMVRKLGGFTFQELNLTIEDIKAMSDTGADLSYDFITRPAYHHALATGDTEFLRLMLGQMHLYKIDPAGLIHALQNHDELTLELVHFWTAHSKDMYSYQGKKITGKELRDRIREDMYSRLMGEKAPYNLKASNGISCTTTSVCAAALGVKDLYAMTAKEKEDLKKLHLLLAMYNSFQPGIFALSGWDLVGALTIPGREVKDLMADGDTRWINRGSYDLMNGNPKATHSKSGLPKSLCLYGPLSEQMKSPDSFARRLQKMLKIREKYRIAESSQVAVPPVKCRGLLVMVHKLPGEGGLEVTAINFGKEKVQETVSLKLGDAREHPVTDLFADKSLGAIKGELPISLDGYEGKALLIK